MRSVTLVAGPPCAGKTTLVKRLASPGAPAFDLDEFAVAAGSPARWMHPKLYLDLADARMWAAARDLASFDGEAWLIRCAPAMGRRWEYAGRIKATRVIVLMPPIEVVLARVGDRPHGTAEAIRDWYRRFTPHRKDVLISSFDEL